MALVAHLGTQLPSYKTQCPSSCMVSVYGVGPHFAVFEDQNARDDESYATKSPFFWSTRRKGLLTGGCWVGRDPLSHVILFPWRTTMFRSGRISKQKRPLAERRSLTSVLVVLTRTYRGGEASSVRVSAASLTMCSSPSYTFEHFFKGAIIGR